MTLAHPRYRHVDFLLLGVAAAWGSTYLTVKDLTRHAPILGLLSTRFALTTLFLGLVVVRQWRSFGKRELFVGTVLGLTQAFIIFLEALGVSKTSASNGGLIISLAIVLTPMMDGLFTKKWLPKSFFFAAAMAFAGVAILISGNGFHKPNVGDALFLLAAFCRGAHVVAFAHMTHESKGRNVSSLRLTWIQSAVCFAIFFLISPHKTFTAFGNYDRNDWFGILYLSIICTALAFFIQGLAIRKTSAARASLLLGTEPIWAVALAVLLGGERLALLAAIGALMIVSGTYWGAEIELRFRKRPQSVHE